MKKKESGSNFKESVRTRTADAMKEVEKMREMIVKEIHQGFDTVSNKVSSAAKSTSQMTEHWRNQVSDIHPREYWDKVVKEVEDLRNELVNGVSVRFNQLRKATEDAVGKATSKTGAKKVSKKTSKKKPASKKTTKKKTAKKAAKKKTAAKKAAKKKVSKKKTTKKQTGKKKVSKKKPARKKKSG